MIEIEYGDEPKYVPGKHADDCPSQRPGVSRVDGDAITFTSWFCTGCLPLDEANPDADLADLLRARLAADTGVRHDLDEVIAAFGLTREELEADEDPTE